MQIKSGVLFQKHDAKMIDRELDELQEDEILVKVAYCNLCTTDYQQWMGLRDHQGFPMAGGHENSATVVEVGSGVDNFEKGDKVAVGYNYCGRCDNCRQGLTYECTNQKTVKTKEGYYGGSGLSNYQIINVRKAIKLGKNVDLQLATFVEPLGTVLHGMDKLHIAAGKTVVVIGAGTMGLLNALVARSYGAHVIVSELQEKQLKRAQEAGFVTIDAKKHDPIKQVKQLTNGVGADIVIGAVGLTQAYTQAFEMLRKQNGKFLNFAAGYPEPEYTIKPNEVHYRQIQIIGTMGGNIKDFIKAGKFLTQDLVDVDKCLEHQLFGLKDINQAYEAAAQVETYRVTVDCQDI